MKTAYLSMDMFFGLLEQVPCRETRMVFEKMIEATQAMDECAEDQSDENKEWSEGMNFAREILQEAMEDYLCARAQHESMLDGPDWDASRN